MVKDKGFTLIEIIITIVILGIIGVFSFSFFGYLTRTYSMMGSKRTVHQEALYAIERISRELRDAKEVNVNNNVLQFERANPTGQDSNKYVKFYLNGTDLYRDSASDSGFTTNTTHNIIARNVTSFTVSPSGTPLASNTVITISIGVTSGETESYSTKICPKNYSDTGVCTFTGRSFGGCYEDKIN
ncbi:MAG TPA: prepilin-type N-terminal cleavage/methylation domain-containing protein [Syntrophorhabdaceae bacterium]|nr:prepilin-type N-terminal cleavage/methylation domain-containing protein [Syntrophorhabdaceae bacterium]HOL04708.1 prepilin-type N-terminal cleavage/methylation domain-containing protein [Syntrophorhabdaceae bacterium]HON85261.1 prepilin-type N-terminal cleavage/methylation domain-containing protein [Syntrophorhabdaceae bacterium]HOT42747.1 prepilin-type N-terminal cleavage/methylation domain-containing protein [Syntrophorhabdaceae bacterium]HPC66142.1 prepilin-type N-terminal cleavage/methyl